MTHTLIEAPQRACNRQRVTRSAGFWMLASLSACAVSDQSPTAAGPELGNATQALTETVPSSAALVARHGLTGEEYQREFDTWTGQGLRLTRLSAYSLDGSPHFAAIWEDLPGPAWTARHGLTGDAYQQEFDRLLADGFRPTLIEGYEEGGEARYAGIWEQQSGPAWQARHGLTHAQYQQEFDTLGAQGFRPTWLQGYSVAGTDYYVGIWEQRDGSSYTVRHGMTADVYQSEFETLAAGGFRPLQISAYDLSGTPYFSAIWEEKPGPLWAAYHGMTGSGYQHQFADFYLRGLRLKQVEGYQTGGGSYAAYWEAEPDALNGDYCTGAQCFSLERAANALEKALQDGPYMKYAFELRRGTAVIQRARGQARTATTPPALDFTVNQRYNPASVGKAITTVATLQLLNQNHVSLDTPVYTFLPSSWNIPANNRTITFEEVLTHTSGFREGNADHAVIKRMAETEIKLEDKKFEYRNGNYGLLRVLDARLLGVTSDSELEIAERFTGHVREKVLAPLGIYDVEYRDASANRVLFYPQPPGASTGTDYGDWTLLPGSAGPHLSTHELAVFVDAVFKEQLLPAESVQLIRDRGLGFEDFGTLPDGNRCHGKSGWFPASLNGDSELSTGLVHCDNGVSGMVVVNGVIDSVGSMSRALMDGF